MKLTKTKRRIIERKLDKAVDLAGEFDELISEIEAEWGKLLGEEQLFDRSFLCQIDQTPCRSVYLPMGLKLLNNTELFEGNEELSDYLHSGKFQTPCDVEDLKNIGNGFDLSDRGAIGRIESLYNSLTDYMDRIEPKKFDYYDKEFRELRLKVFLRDGEICACCGVTPRPGVSLTVDHIKPASKFPELVRDVDNLQVLCWECNQKKSNRHFTDYRKEV